jgi:phosphohistidine phosphatase
MDLILWRHADAEDGAPDLARKLTAKGERQAARVAEWLLGRLPAGFAVISSPALRARQTAEALGVAYDAVDELAPGASAAQVILAAGWPARVGALVLVGHQPTLGQVLARLLAGTEAEWSIRKGGFWWLASRERHGEAGAVVKAVLAPELL